MDLELEEVYDGDVLSLWLLYDEQHSPSWVNAGMKWYGEKQTQVITFSSHGNFAAIYTSEQRAKDRNVTPVARPLELRAFSDDVDVLQ